MSDLYVLCSYNHSDQQTDVHYRSANGCGNYNWRMIFPQKLPIQENAVLSLRIYDKDFFSKDDYLCSGTFAINDLLNQAFENEESVKMYLGTEDMS